MPNTFARRFGSCQLLLAVLAASTDPAVAADERAQRVDYLSLARGVVPVALEGAAKALRVGMEQALLAIDGNDGGFSLTPKPGGADTRIVFVYKLPAPTSFEQFAIPNILETPSPSQTFVRKVEIAGSDSGAGGPFRTLASATLTTHSAPGQRTTLAAVADMPVRWIRLSLEGGIDVQRDKTFFEFSEIAGYGHQQPVPMSTTFSGQWKGPGVVLELHQDGAQVTGCYDRDGHLTGTVSGNLLRATGQSRPAGIKSVFLLALGEQDEITGVRSTNGAPFRLYSGSVAPGLRTECSRQAAPPLGCGAVIHGIEFDFDSATIRPQSDPLLDVLSDGLKSSTAAQITVVGHTSSEGSDAYNDDLSYRRAQAVATAAAARGVDPARITARGRGERQPIADNSTEAGRSLNRRVEVVCQ
jgi:OOP family OmpA-OmpF porin